MKETKNINIAELNKQIESDSAFIDLLVLEINTVSYTHLTLPTIDPV